VSAAGHCWLTVRQHSRNAQLRRQGEPHKVLLSGDVVVIPAIRRLRQKASIGYSPDLDLAEVFDARMGDGIPVGSGKEKDSGEQAYLQRRRSNRYLGVNLSDDVRNLPLGARGPAGQRRVGLGHKASQERRGFQDGADHES